MTIERARIKRAARLRWERMNPGISWDNVREDAKAQMEESIARTAADLFPELDGEEPEAWLAPMEATEAMEDVADAVALDREQRGFAPNGAGKWLFIAMRDAHLNEQMT